MQARRRLRAKTPDSQTPVLELEDFAAQEVSSSRVAAYLVTFPHPRETTSADGFPLRAPGSMTRRELLECFLDSCGKPEYVDAKSKSSGCSVPLDRVSVYFELNKADSQGQTNRHGHVAAAALGGFRFVPVKRALLQRHGLASHWSPHEGYWSAVRYCSWPSPKKP